MNETRPTLHEHISRSQALTPTQQPQTDLQTDNTTYTIEKILCKKFVNKQWFYRVKWLSYPSSNNSWVSFDDLTEDCKKYVLNTYANTRTDKKSRRKN